LSLQDEVTAINKFPKGLLDLKPCCLFGLTKQIFSVQLYS